MDTPQPAGTIWTFQLRGRVQWVLSDAASEETALGCAPGWNLLTPLAMARCSFAGELDVKRLPDGRRWVTADTIALRAIGQENFESARDTFARTTRALRYLVRQFELPEVWIGLTPGSHLAAVNLPPEIDIGPGFVTRSYYLRTGITDDTVAALPTLAREFAPPVSAMVMLDALLALVDQDFRKALLYGAIAVESRAESLLAEAYERALASPVNDPRLRVVSVNIGGGQVVKKDPTYEALGDDNFGRRLHERPLYLLGKSLRVDDEASYTKALRLYKTRNKLAHIGDVPVGPDTFDISEAGAKAGLEAAAQTLEWFGDPGPYEVGLRFVDVVTGKIAMG